MGSFKELEEALSITKPVDKWRVHINKYIIDRRIVIGTFVILSLFIVLLASLYGLNDYYFWECPANGSICYNPYVFYDYNPPYEKVPGSCILPDKNICAIDYLLPGEHIGVKIPFLIENFMPFTIALFICAFFLNHFIYNRKYGLLSKIWRGGKVDKRLQD